MSGHILDALCQRLAIYLFIYYRSYHVFLSHGYVSGHTFLLSSTRDSHVMMFDTRACM